MTGATKPALKVKDGIEEFVDNMKDFDILALACIALFRVDIGFIVPSLEVQEVLFENSGAWVRDVAKIYHTAHPNRVRLGSARAYEILETPENTSCIHGKDYSHYIFMWCALSNPGVMMCFAKSALESSGAPFEELLFSRLLRDNLVWWASRENMEVGSLHKYSDERPPALALGEIALISLLTSTQTAVCHNACVALQTLAIAEHHPEAARTTHFSEDVKAKRLLIYEQLLSQFQSKPGMYRPFHFGMFLV